MSSARKSLLKTIVAAADRAEALGMHNATIAGLNAYSAVYKAPDNVAVSAARFALMLGAKPKSTRKLQAA